MSFLLDLILILIVVATVVRCASQGFVRSIVSLVSMAVAAVVAWQFYPQLAEYLEAEIITDRITDYVASTIRSLSSAGTGFDFTRLFADMPADFVSLIERFEADTAILSHTFGAMEAATAEAADQMAYTIAEPVVHGLANVCAFVLLFVVASIACSILGGILDLIVKLPVLRTANRFLGFLLGVVCAAVLALGYAEAAELVMDYLSTVDPIAFDVETIDRTMLVRHICTLFSGQ